MRHLGIQVSNRNSKDKNDKGNKGIKNNDSTAEIDLIDL